MIDHHGAWLPSVTWGIPALILGLIVCLGLVFLALVHCDDLADFIALSSLPVLGALAIVIGPMFGYWPWEGDYHRLQPASGVVQSVDSRFLAASQHVVVTYNTGLVVRCDDSRCATVKPGQQLRLLCTKEHQFGSPLGADGWSCRWGQADG